MPSTGRIAYQDPPRCFFFKGEVFLGNSRNRHMSYVLSIYRSLPSGTQLISDIEAGSNLHLAGPPWKWKR